jgi:hypothetical protein
MAESEKDSAEHKGYPGSAQPLKMTENNDIKALTGKEEKRNGNAGRNYSAAEHGIGAPKGQKE